MASRRDRVFISYSRADEKFARKIAVWIAKTLNTGVWIDVEDIPVGSKWSNAIQSGLNSAEVMVVIITPEAMTSRNVEDEWQYFLDQGKPIVPILLRSAPVPYQLKRIQYIDFSVPEEYPNSLRELITLLRTHLKPLKGEQSRIASAQDIDRQVHDAIASTKTKKEQQQEKALKTSQIVNIILGIIVLALIGVIAAVIFLLSQDVITVNVAQVSGSDDPIIIDPEGVQRFLSTYEGGNIPVNSIIFTGDSTVRVSGASGEAVLEGNTEAGVGDLNETVSVNLQQGAASVRSNVGASQITTVSGVIDAQEAIVEVNGEAVQADCYTDCTISDGEETVSLTGGERAIFSSLSEVSIEQIPGDIAFVSFRHGLPELYLMNPDGSNPTRLTNNLYGDFAPAWSPDGTVIAYVTQQNGNNDIAVIEPNPENPQQIILTDHRANDEYPAWSADSNRIAFTSNRDGTDEIYIYDIATREITRLTENNAVDTQPTWDPTGNRIAYVSSRSGNNDIWIYDFDTGEEFNLTLDQASDEEPVWSPDGSRIAFTSRRDGNIRNIWSIAVDMPEDIINVTNRGADAYEAAWSPDGAQIIFTSAGNGNNDIFAIASDGSGEAINISNNNGGADEDAAWLPRIRAGQ